MEVLRFENAKYILSAPNNKTLPITDLPEIAFFGRSNVGKSSLLNLLANQNKLARVSKTPGRTRALNLFEAELEKQKVSLLDLPGYGYAKLSHAERAELSAMLHGYLKDREQLEIIVHLLDCRREPNEEDIRLSYEFRKHVPNYLVGITKSDKLPISKRKVNQKKFAQVLDINPNQTVMLSTLNKSGQTELLEKFTQFLSSSELE